MRIMEIDGLLARCEARGVTREVSLLMLDGEALSPGIFVVVHLGHAISIITEDEARAAWEIYEEMLELNTGAAASAR